MKTEREVKLDVPADFVLPDLEGTVDGIRAVAAEPNSRYGILAQERRKAAPVK